MLEPEEEEGEDCYWIEDEEGNEGFSGNEDETSWVLEDHDAFEVRNQGVTAEFEGQEEEKEEIKSQKGACWLSQLLRH